MKCRICSNKENNLECEAKEMMFRLDEAFVYFQCSLCGCLQIKEFPENIAKYYPSDYYSYKPVSKVGPLTQIIIRLRNNYEVFKTGFLGQLISGKFPNPTLRALNYLNLNKESSILDVGCGKGEALNHLKEIGFKNLLGIDPFNEYDITYENGLIIEKKILSEVNGKWDLIMFIHSFEHLMEQESVLKTVFSLLSEGGVCLIKVPISSSYAFKHYGVDWVQLDAPRHFFLHSIKSMEILTKKMGFKITKTSYESTSFQLWGSEQYKKGVLLTDENSYLVNKKKSIFSKREIKEFEKKAHELNEEGLGDEVAFYLQKI
ncbi:MAG: class I SAM-dependent methyltransferase [Flavobacteriaceae bacterium]|nr:class I SAM-dependent methyltransferase [Flavobacteriaceae bacterium]